MGMEMLLTADPISSTEAYRLGLVNKVCDSEEIDEVTIKLAEKISQFSGESIALGKKTFYE
jgi:enoyl-CoA hydratase/carnithine racemase